MDDIERVRHLEPEVTEKRVWNLRNLLASVVVFIIIVIVFIGVTVTLNLDLLFLTMVACFFIVIYSIVLFFLLEPKIVREVNQTSIRTVQRPVVRSIVVEKPVQIMHETEKRIYITNPIPEKKKLNIPRYDYVGSTQTKTYHKRSCRLGKLIKNKYKMSNNDPNFFLKNQYKPCEVCILKIKKV